MVDFANGFQASLEALMVLDSALNLGQLLGREADLFVSAAGAADRQDRDGMPSTVGAYTAAAAMADEPAQQRTANGFGQIGQP